MSVRRLPIAPVAAPARRNLPLAERSRVADRMLRPVYAVWEITLRCDQSCRHCGSRAGHARPDELSPAQALDLVHQLADLGVREVTLIGGEAYLREDWLQLVAALRKRGVLCSVTTGGRGLDAARALAAHEAGVQSMSVSVDGLVDAHDRLRGVAGSHASAMSAIAAIRGAGMRVSCNTQINQWNRHQLPALLGQLLDAGVTAWQPQLTAPLGRAADEHELVLQPYHLLELFPVLAALADRCHDAGVLFWPGNSIGYYGPFEQRLRAKVPGGHRGACGAGRATLGIEADGTVKGCPSLPTADHTAGNVRDAPLVEIWERGLALRRIRDQRVDELRGFCRGCYYADECRGGCNFTAQAIMGDIGDNPLCHHRALVLAESGERERLVPSEAAPGQPFDHGRFTLVREPWPADESAALDIARASLLA